MNRVKVKLNYAGVGSILKSGATADMCRQHAYAISGRAGQGYIGTTWMGDTRVIGSVQTETFRAMRDNSKHQTLLRALGG